MNTSSNRDLDTEVAEAMKKLREIRDVFGKIPTQDLPFPAGISHVHEHKHEDSRLRQYGHQVIGNRCLHFAMLTTVKAFYNIELYLDSVQGGNPLALPMAARAQLELFAVAWHVYEIISLNAGSTQPHLAERMSKVDDALITAIYGTRSDEIVKMYTETNLSRLRETTPRDLETFKAKNILTRIEKTAKGSAYQWCAHDYDRLCELLHPNSLQNLLFMLPSPKGEGWFRLGLASPVCVRRAQYQTVHPMVNASSEILELIVETPEPFANAEDRQS